MQNMHQEDDLSSPFVAPFTWDDDDWKTWNAMVAFRDQAPAVAPREEAAAAGFWPLYPGSSKEGRATATPVAATTSSIPQIQTVTPPTPVTCDNIASIPPGRQASAILQCGICMSPHLYARKADLKRHMETHLPATHFCHVNNCPRGPGNGFKRIDKLHEHLNKKHGLRQN